MIYNRTTDVEFKVYTYIQEYKKTHNNRIPAEEHVAKICDKSVRTIYRTYKSLREKNLLE